MAMLSKARKAASLVLIHLRGERSLGRGPEKKESTRIRESSFAEFADSGEKVKAMDFDSACTAVRRIPLMSWHG
jgi:hypothetical protein